MADNIASFCLDGLKKAHMRICIFSKVVSVIFARVGKTAVFSKQNTLSST